MGVQDINSFKVHASNIGTIEKERKSPKSTTRTTITTTTSEQISRIISPTNCYNIPKSLSNYLNY